MPVAAKGGNKGARYDFFLNVKQCRAELLWSAVGRRVQEADCRLLTQESLNIIHLPIPQLSFRHYIITKNHRNFLYSPIASDAEGRLL